MKFTIEIECDNDAFGPDDLDLCQEVRRCLTVVRDALTSKIAIPIMDANGNTVGWAKFTDE